MLLAGLLLAGCGSGKSPALQQAWQTGETRRYIVTVDENYLEQQHLPLAATDPARVDPTIITQVRAQVFMTCTGTDSAGNFLLACGYDSFMLSAEARGESTCLGFSGDTIYFYNRAGLALAVPAALAPPLVPTEKRPWRVALAATGDWQPLLALPGEDTFPALAAVWRELFPPLRGEQENWEVELPLPAPAPPDKPLRYVVHYAYSGLGESGGERLAEVAVSADNDLAGMARQLPGDTSGLIPTGTAAVFEVWREQRHGQLFFSAAGGALRAGNISLSHEETVASRLPDPVAVAGEGRFARKVTMARRIAWQAIDLPRVPAIE